MSDELREPFARPRMSAQDRRRQLLGIGLRKFVERPVQDLSLDEVAAEAGVSRGLLFHYFPTKTAYHDAVIAAAGRRVLRTVRPEPQMSGDDALRHIVERFLDQITRRREFYLALVFGQVGRPSDDIAPGTTAISLRESLARLVLDTLGLPDARLATVQAWVAYLEDRALRFSAAPADAEGEIAHCMDALHALLGLDEGDAGGITPEGSRASASGPRGTSAP